MDETRFPRFFADADLCLRLRASGLRILVTPHARVIDRRTVITRDSPAAAREFRAFRARWGEALLADPSYSPLLALDASPWSALAHPPRDAAPRRASLPPMADVPPGF
jgi:GT2 family glycosyltransferase